MRVSGPVQEQHQQGCDKPQQRNNKQDGIQTHNALLLWDR
jgi:hypothetical protein